MYTDKEGRNWYKGNLHMHTTESDGRKTPEEAYALYRAAGYDFVVRTEHWKPSENGSCGEMLLLSGCEYDTGDVYDGGLYHLIAVGTEKPAEVRKGDDAQTITDRIHEAGGIVGHAHPAWSLNTPEQMIALRGADYTEIFNSVSDVPFNCRPYSGDVVDMTAVQGKYMLLAAADDTHFYTEVDTCRSFVYVQADSLTREAILQAIREGRFYASQGPRLRVLRKRNRIEVECSPVSQIVYFTDMPWESERCETGVGLTHGTFMIREGRRFVRVEVTDSEGRRAWSQYIVL